MHPRVSTLSCQGRHGGDPAFGRNRRRQFGEHAMSTATKLDLNLRNALHDTASEQDLRPSVLRSEFFYDYSIKRILEDPRQAWFDLAHTRGVGGKSTKAIAAAVAQELEQNFADDWPKACKLAQAGADAAPVQDWPLANLVTFITVWQPGATPS
jgi:hypothetical protein